MSYHSLARPLSAITAVLTLTALGACAELTGTAKRQPASVSFNVASPGTSASLGASLVIITDGQHTLDVQSLDVVFDEVTFERAHAAGGDADSDDSDADSDSDGSHNEQIRVGASTVSLPLEGGVITPFTGTLPAGTYDGLELDAAFLRVRGTFDGQAFDVTLPVDAEFELAINPPLVVGADDAPLNVTVNVDVMAWFRDAAGATVDPRRLQTDATYRAAFVSRIRASLRALEDSDLDGDDSDSDSDG